MEKISVHTYHSFKRSSVEAIPFTEQIIQDSMPYFPKHVECIGGYVDDSKQFWKVNYHWELLRKKIEEAISSGILDDRLKKCAKAVLAGLLNNPPSPSKGYLNSKRMGSPQDTTSRDLQIARWKTVRQAKRDFKTIITKAGIIGPGKNEKKHVAWYLAVAPVARPGTSKHGCGYALDLCGRNKKDNPDIRRISAALGASLVFDEHSHVHVEFKKGGEGGAQCRGSRGRQQSEQIFR